MALRLLPFRQYAEENVINLYKIDPLGDSKMDKPFENGANDNGVLVKVSAGNMDEAPVGYETQSYLGKTDYPFIGRDQYPVVSLAVQAADNSASALGVTLRQTLTHDENGEKLLYYPQTASERQAVLTGQAVPVLTKGVITLDGDTAFETSLAPTAIGERLYPASSSEPGKFSTSQGGTEPSVGTVIATGSRVNRGVSSDYFAGNSIGTSDPTTASTASGAYYVVSLNC